MQTLPKIMGIIGLVISSFSLLLASIPCFGSYAMAPGVIGAICCLIAFIQLKSQQQTSIVSLTGMAIGVVAFGVAYYQYYRMENLIGDTVEVIEEKTKDKAKEILLKELKEVIEEELNEDHDSISKDKKQPAK